MSVPMTTGDIVSIRLEYKLGTDTAYNVLHYSLQNITNPSTGLPLATTVDPSIYLPMFASQAFDRFSASWKIPASNEVMMTGVTAQDVFPLPRSRPYTYVPGGPVLGAIVDDALPLQDSPTILKETNVGMRWGLGRVFYVGLPESAQDSGILNPAAITQMATFISDLAGQFVFGDAGAHLQFIPCLFSIAGPTTRMTPITSTKLSDNVIKVQKRRRPGKGI